MKALKVVGIVVGVVAIVATAGAALAPAAFAASGAMVSAGGFLGMSAATLGTIGTIATLAAAGIGVAGSLFMPKPSFSTEGNPLNFQTNPQSGLPYAIGRTRMSGVRIHADTVDAPRIKSESKQDVLAFAVLLSAGGPIQEIEKFRADKEQITFNPSSGDAIGTYNKWMAQKVSLGSVLAGTAALAMSFGSAPFPGWSADHKLSGISHALWALRYDEKGDHFAAGVPEPEWIGKWVKVYDPRKDSTYPGGSGSHRALDESTYEWSANPALHALTWSLGRWANGKRTLGIGAPVENIRVADFVEAANVADVNNWTCGGVEWSTDSKWSILKRMLQAGGAEPTMTGAMIGCRVNTPRVSIATVTADKLLDNASFPTTRSRRDRFNTVIPRYRSEDHDWEVISGEPIQVAAYVAEDGGPRTKEIDFPLVQKEAGSEAGNEQAGHLATYEIVNSREAGPWRFTVGPEYIGVKTGDVITLDVPDEGIAAQPVLVRSRSIDPASFKITFEVETETDAKHDFALGKTSIPPPSYTPTPPDLTPPTPSSSLWTLEALTGTSLPSIRVAGVCEFPGADVVLINYRKVGAAEWTTLSPAEASEPVDTIVNTVDWNASYEARVAYKSGQRVGPWLNLSAVTTPTFELGSSLASNIRLAQIRNPRTTANVARSLLIASDVGSTATISVARHDWDYPESTDLTRELGTRTGLAFNTLYYVYFDDASLGAGTVTYQATTNFDTAQNSSTNPGRHFLGGIKTPADGGAPTESNGVIDMGRSGPSLYAGLNYLNHDVYQVVNNFNADNDANALAPDAPTGVSLSSILMPDGSALTTVSWAFTQGGTPQHKNHIDGFLVGLKVNSTSGGYTYNHADRNTMRWAIVRPDVRAQGFGLPADRYTTGIVIPFRKVRTDINSAGEVLGAVGQSSATTPHHPVNSPQFTGVIGSSISAANVELYSNLANSNLDAFGVRANKVSTAAIIAGALNEADWQVQGGTLGLNNETFEWSWFTVNHVAGAYFHAQLLLDYQMEIVNPSLGATVTMTVELVAKRVSNGLKYYSDAFTITEVWHGATQSGIYSFPRKNALFEHIYTSLPAGAFDLGYRIGVSSGAVGMRPYRFIRGEDRRAFE